MVAWVILRIGPALMTASVTTGSTRWPSVDQSACQLPAMRLSMIRKLVTGGGGSTAKSMRPSGAGATCMIV